MNTYEGMFLLDSAKAATAWDDTVKHVHDILTKHHSEIVASRQWDERRLAYSISGHKKGTYLLTYFRTEGDNLKEIVADCRLSDVILRELVLEGAPQAGRPPGQPGDDVDAQRRRGGRWPRRRVRRAAAPSPPRRLSRAPRCAPVCRDRALVRCSIATALPALAFLRAPCRPVA